MKALTKEEIDLLLGEGHFPEQEWIEYKDLTESEKIQRKQYAIIRGSLVRKGLIKITKKGRRENGGYIPAQMDYTEYGKQIVDWLLRIKDLEGAMLNIKKIARGEFDGTDL